MRESEVLRRAGERHEKFAVSEAVFARWCEVAPRDQCPDAVASPAAACREPHVTPGTGEQRTPDARFDTDAPIVEDPDRTSFDVAGEVLGDAIGLVGAVHADR